MYRISKALHLDSFARASAIGKSDKYVVNKDKVPEVRGITEQESDTIAQKVGFKIEPLNA